jgi:hypothetical protein
MKRNRTAHCIASLSLAAVFLFLRGAAPAEEQPQPKIRASAIQILMVQSDEVTLPIAFRLALYENLIEHVQKTNKFQHVYRDGDPAATTAPDLIILHSNVYGFKKGSEEKRQATTVSGATSIKVHCLFTDKTGRSELAQDVTGEVRFMGGNLRATLDFAKKVAKIVVNNFQ